MIVTDLQPTDKFYEVCSKKDRTICVAHPPAHRVSCTITVSYTHLDVYKRQGLQCDQKSTGSWEHYGEQSGLKDVARAYP